jgi:hypothetical protein
MMQVSVHGHELVQVAVAVRDAGRGDGHHGAERLAIAVERWPRRARMRT